MAYTEFCVRASGSNLNAGSLDGTTNEPATNAAFTYSNGSWVSGTGVFTSATTNPLTDGVLVGQFASVYTDGGSPPASTSFVGRITARDATTITVSTTAKMGTIPTTGSNITLRVGGAWVGMGASGFPITLVDGACTNSSANNVRVNIKNDQTYTVSAQIADAAGGTTVYQGYSSTYGDGGKFDLTGGSSGASYVLLAIAHADIEYRDMIIHGNGATTNSHLVSTSGNRNAFTRCVFHDCRGAGCNPGTSRVVFAQCEFYNCNQSNNAAYAGIVCSQAVTCLNCIFHDNTGSNTSGVQTGANNLEHVFDRCIFESNGAHGMIVNVAVLQVSNCDFYNNGGDGLQVLGNVNHHVIVENCNFVKNTSNGVNIDNTNPSKGFLLNCGFGSGTQANGTATTIGAKSAVENVNPVTYASGLTPWVDPANGDFRINLATAESAGFGTFTQTAGSYAGTVAYPDIGAGQHLPGSQPIANPVLITSKGAYW